MSHATGTTATVDGQYSRMKMYIICVFMMMMTMMMTMMVTMMMMMMMTMMTMMMMMMLMIMVMIMTTMMLTMMLFMTIFQGIDVASAITVETVTLQQVLPEDATVYIAKVGGSCGL